jgi:carboxyl-terminal processing protease
VEVADKEIADISRVLIQKSYLFDYATRYRAEHASIAPARSFKLSDADYQKFVDFLKSKDINYNTDVEKSLTDLTKKAKEEKHYDDVKTELEAIRRKVSTNKSNDLMRFKPEIREMLEQEIVSRYYFQKGSIEASFDDDPNILTAMNVLNDPPRYAALLKPGTPESKTRPEANRKTAGGK